MRIKPLLVAALGATACLSPTDVCGCPPALGIGTVAGVVTRGGGTPVPGAEVRVEARPWGCIDPRGSDLVGPPFTHADGAGVYRYLIRASIPSDTACLRLVARDPAAAASDSVVVDGLRMRLIPSYGTRQRPDSLRVDFRLP